MVKKKWFWAIEGEDYFLKYETNIFICDPNEYTIICEISIPVSNLQNSPVYIGKLPDFLHFLPEKK